MGKRTKQPVASERQDPIDILFQEHAITLKYLQQLHTATEFIRVNGFNFDAFQKIEEAIHFIDAEIRHHNEKEEAYLFPLMDRHLKEPPDVMRTEHLELWKSLAALRECIKDVLESRIYPTIVRELVHRCFSITELLSNHIAKENNVLFPMAKKMLTKEEYELFRTQMAKATPSTA